MTMRRTAIVWATLAWAAWTGGGRAAAQQTVQVPNEPGRATQARVYVINRDRADAIPVTLQGVASTDPLRVTWSGTPAVTLSETSTVPTRVVRQNWEYRTITLRATEDPTPALNTAGAEGWEALGPALLLQNGDVRWMLKRPR
ncbi:MAG TPA: hypothetical protein VES67_09755 [Vicinamibacterales bacterium]|nr:hypothetical protein [Vicinamibacterales bacterium]